MAQTTANPSRSCFGSSLTKPPIRIMDYLRILVARDQQRREPVEEWQVAYQRERLVFGHRV